MGIHTKYFNISKTVGDTSTVTVNHRLNGSSSPVLTPTHNSYGSLRLFEFFSCSTLEASPKPIFTQNGSNDVDSRKDVCVFYSKNRYFS